MQCAARDAPNCEWTYRLPEHFHHLAADENVGIGPLVTATEQVAGDY